MELQTYDSLNRLHGLDVRPGRGGNRIVRTLRRMAAYVNRRFIQPVRQEMRIRDTIRQLEALDNRMLDDLGLNRLNIESVVRENARLNTLKTHP